MDILKLISYVYKSGTQKKSKDIVNELDKQKMLFIYIVFNSEIYFISEFVLCLSLLACTLTNVYLNADSIYVLIYWVKTYCINIVWN